MSISLGIVVIGRNEGARLERCLRSVLGQADRIVYVDSGSTDDSVARARQVGVDVVELDPARPFTMARGRNAGFDHLLTLAPRLEYVQFVDGDCEVEPGWIAGGRKVLEGRPDAAVVCGRRRERYPEKTRYNLLADMEWDGPPGEVAACGGDALARALPLRQVNGYAEELIAGEEPELCLRLRALGWKILRVGAPMTIHDAGLETFGQWWRRMVRSGYAYAEGALLHDQTRQRHRLRPFASALGWGAGVPLALLGTLLLAATGRPAALAAWPLLLAAYGVVFWRAYRWRRRHGRPAAQARLYAAFCVAAKFAEVQGIARFGLDRWRRRPARLIEYKGVEVRGH